MISSDRALFRAAVGKPPLPALPEFDHLQKREPPFSPKRPNELCSSRCARMYMRTGWMLGRVAPMSLLDRGHIFRCRPGSQTRATCWVVLPQPAFNRPPERHERQVGIDLGPLGPLDHLHALVWPNKKLHLPGRDFSLRQLQQASSYETNHVAGLGAATGSACFAACPFGSVGYYFPAAASAFFTNSSISGSSSGPRAVLERITPAWLNHVHRGKSLHIPVCAIPPALPVDPFQNVGQVNLFSSTNALASFRSLSVLTPTPANGRPAW